MIKAELIDVGRNKVCKTITVKNIDEVEAELHKHLMSSEIDIVTSDEQDVYTVIVGGMRPVGKVRLTRLVTVNKQ